MLNIRFRIATMPTFSFAASTAVARPYPSKPVTLVWKAVVRASGAVAE